MWGTPHHTTPGLGPESLGPAECLLHYQLIHLPTSPPPHQAGSLHHTASAACCGCGCGRYLLRSEARHPLLQFGLQHVRYQLLQNAPMLSGDRQSPTTRTAGSTPTRGESVSARLHVDHLPYTSARPWGRIAPHLLPELDPHVLDHGGPSVVLRLSLRGMRGCMRSGR
jgi:hypothetical protein